MARRVVDDCHVGGWNIGRRWSQCDQYVHRPRYRRVDGANQDPPSRHWVDCATKRTNFCYFSRNHRFFRPVDRREPLIGHFGAVRHLVLRLCLFLVAEAHEQAKHRDWWRSWCSSRPCWLGSRHEFSWLDPVASLHRHLFVDSTPFLGSGHPPQRRLQGGRCSHASRGRIP